MKVSETATPKNQDPQNGNGPASNLRKQQRNGGGVNGARGKNGSSESQSGRTEKSSKSIRNNEEKKSPTSQPGTPERKEGKNGSSSPDTKKPWIPCARRSSKPKPLPDILDMEFSLLDSSKVCKKFPKLSNSRSSSTDTENPQRKINSDGINGGLTNNANNNGSVFDRLSSTNGNNATTNGTKSNENANINATSSIERRAVLKRQFALDKAPTSNLKESTSNESLNSINSVTQLLKIERAFPLNNKPKDEDKEEEVLTGVKLIAARLEAKNANNSRPPPIRNGMKNNRASENGHLKSNDNSDDNEHAFNSNTRSGHLQTKHNDLASLQKKYDEEKASILAKSTSSRFVQQDVGNVGSQQILAKSQTTTTAPVSEAKSTSSALLNAAAAAVSSSIDGRKKVNSNKASPSTSAPSPSSKSSSAAISSQVSKSRPSSPDKRGQRIASQTGNQIKSKSSIRSRSNSPVKFPAIVKPPPRNGIAKTEANNNPCSSPKTAKKFPSSNSRSSSSTRKNSLASSNSSPSSSPPKSDKATNGHPLSKQTNLIKEKNGEPTSQNRGRIRISENKSNLINPNQRGSANNSIDGGGPVQSRNVNGNGIETHPSKRNSRKSDDADDSRPVKRYALPTIASQASGKPVVKSVVERGSSLTRQSRERSRTRGRKSDTTEEVQPSNNRAIRGKLILKEKLTKEPCKLESNTGRNKSIVTSKASSSEDVLDYSLSSLSTPSVSSSVSVTSSPSASWRSRKKQQEARIIPSIIMSEYVEGKENGKASTVVKHSQSLFTPLQFIEPLKKSCDIKEGSSLELNVRVRGAEAVVWVKENKIIPNAPPDFQYFTEKSKDLYGLRIADVFLQDAGLYVCEAYGTGGSEITCWCEVDVIEANGNDDEDVDDNEEDISWEDLDISEEIQSPQPLVVPVIVTSQAEERGPTPTFETAQSKEPSPVRTVPVKQVKIDEQAILKSNACWDPSDRDQLITTKRISRKSANNESALSNSSGVSGTMKKSQSPSEAPAINYCDGAIHERVTEFASENAVMKTPKEFSYPGESTEETVTAAAPPVPIVLPEEEAKGDNERCIFEQNESTEEQSQSQHDDSVHTSVGMEKRKLVSQLSSASDESIYLKEPSRSGDEGALSSNEETSGATFLDRKISNATNDEINTVTSESPPVSSPFSEQNNDRSSSVDSAIGFLGRPLFSDGKFPPRILVGPSSIIALCGEVVHLRVKVQNYGIPKTSVNWFKFINGTYKKIESSTAATVAGDQSKTSSEDTHVSISKCGASLSTLSITNINYDDCGRYRVKVQNLLGMDSHDCLLTVEGPPEAPTTPPKVKYDEKSKTILIQWSSCPYDGGSKITGYYVEVSIVQSSKTAINKEDQDNWQLLTPQSYSWLCYTLTEPKRGSVYRFRVFGENIYGKGKPTEASLPLLVPILMDGRRAGSSDALLWSLKSLSEEETSLRANSKGNAIVHECENEMASTTDESVSSQEEEEPVDYKNVTVRRESFYNVYDKLDELGKGRFGVVFEVVNKETKKSYAGKFVKCIKGKDKERVQLEVQIMNDLEYHPKLICLIDAFEMPREIVIVTQQINGGELFERVVADDFTLTEGDCITFLRQICDAVGYIHTKNIMHLDLKPENILCTSKTSNSIKIIDFGLAQYHNPEEPIRVLFGTAEFVSPEIINYEPIGPSTDNWSVGVITYILLSGLSPFMGDNDNETFSNITRAEFDFDDESFEQISEDAKDFISNLLVKRPEKRMTADECLNHRWVKENDDKKKVILSTDKLKRFLVRRKWQKTGNAIRALGRITTLYSSRRSSSTSSSPSSSMSISSPPPAHHTTSPSSRSGSLATQDSADYDNVFFASKQQSPLTKPGSQDNAISSNNNNANLAFNNNVNQKISRLPLRTSPLIQSSPSAESDASTNRTKFNDPCRRSDSGVCDVGSFSSSLNYD